MFRKDGFATQHSTLSFKLFVCWLFAIFSYSQAQGFVEDRCPQSLVAGEVEGETLICGRLHVPESRQGGSGQMLELAVMILKAKADPLPDPIIFLQGGPGGAALIGKDWFQDKPWRKQRDIILIDQRGTGYSQPNLSCPGLGFLGTSLAIRACFERLVRSGVDVQAYNSRENAADIEALRQALGHKEVNLFGVSYGTRLALTVARDYPLGVRSLVLDSAYPPQVERLVELGTNFNRALEQVFTDCNLNHNCSQAYPGLRETFFLALESLESQSVFPELINSNLILQLYFQAMYSSEVVPYLPFSMQALSEGDLSTTLLILAGINPEDLEQNRPSLASILEIVEEFLTWFWREVQAEGVYFATECQEDVLFQRSRTVIKANQVLHPLLANAMNEASKGLFAACQQWPVERADMLENEAIASDIPSLILAGSYDPITPPEWGSLASSSLSQGHFVTFPGLAHGVFVSEACPSDIIGAFLAEPLTRPSTDCIAEMTFEFYIEDLQVPKE